MTTEEIKAQEYAKQKIETIIKNLASIDQGEDGRKFDWFEWGIIHDVLREFYAENFLNPKLKIYEFQAKQIEDTFRLVARVLESHKKETSVDRDVMQSWQMIKNVLSGEIDKHVQRL